MASHVKGGRIPAWGNFDKFRNPDKWYENDSPGSQGGITLFWMLSREYEQWAQSAASYFREAYGLEGSFALDCARLYVALWGKGLNPRITSGFRDPKKQAAMRAAWDRGDRAGLRVRPADPNGSRHCKTSFLGFPAATGIDMPCTDDRTAAAVAAALGLKAGITFSVSDPGHYQKK